MRGRLWLEGCGAAILFTLAYTWFHISPLHSDLYHRFLPMNAVYWGVAVDVILVCLFLVLVFYVLDRLDPGGRTLWWTLLGGLLAARTAYGLAVAGLIGYPIATPVRVFLLFCAAGLVFWIWKRNWYRQAVRGMRFFLLLLGFFIFWMLPELIYMAVKPEPRDVAAFTRPVSSEVQNGSRIVWLLFDELSYDQVFDHRQPDIRLPNLDRFAAQSVSFSKVQPIGYYTELIIPSLLWGENIEQERSNLLGHASVRTRQGWQAYPDNQTLFADARVAGMPAGAVGWYIPYCRTFSRDLDWCDSSLGGAIQGNYSPDKPALWNVLAPVIKPIARLSGRWVKQPTTAQDHAELYRGLMESSRSLIADERIRFVFIHLPVPHPGGFYDRRTRMLGANGSYLDNLVLADETMAQLLDWIGETQSASQTTVVLTSDHSWRVGMWKMSPLWTAEDQRVSQDRFDPRPVLMVRFPQSMRGEQIATPFPQLQLHTLLQQMIAGQIVSNADLDTWLAENASQP
jgi:F0F1-type ATP synthase assembly protein I